MQEISLCSKEDLKKKCYVKYLRHLCVNWNGFHPLVRGNSVRESGELVGVPQQFPEFPMG